MSAFEWMKRDTEPSPEELASFEGLSPMLRDTAARDSESLDEEVRALAAWRPKPAPGAWLPAGLLVPVLLTAMVLGVVLWRSPSPPESFRTQGIARWTATEQGAVTTVVQGLGTRNYAVEPVAPSGSFRVIAHDVTVTVLGTAFVVRNAPPEVVVEVSEGRVQVDHPWGRTVLSRGERWSRLEAMPEEPTLAASRTEVPAPPVAPARTPPPPSEPPARVQNRRYAKALERFSKGERTEALAADFATLTQMLESPLKDEAEALSLQIGATVWGTRAAHTALESWLDSHPRAPQRWAVLEAKADLERDRMKSYRRAYASYTQLTVRADRAGKRRAFAWKGLCAITLGLEEPGRKDLERSLELGLNPPLREQVQAVLEETTSK